MICSRHFLGTPTDNHSMESGPLHCSTPCKATPPPMMVEATSPPMLTLDATPTPIPRSRPPPHRRSRPRPHPQSRPRPHRQSRPHPHPQSRPRHHRQNSSNDVCNCGSLLGGLIKCDEVNQVALIRAGFCMSVDNSTNELVVSFTNYKYLGNKINTSYSEEHRAYSVLPRNISKTENIFCSYQNQEGFLCGKCVKDHALAFNSLHSECTDCKDYFTPAIILLTLLTLMTIFFVLVVVFQLNFASGPLLGYIMFSQSCVALVRMNVGFYDSLLASLSPFGRVVLKISLNVSELWWYFSIVMYEFPATCIQQNISNLQVITFEYILVLYPMLLVLVTYIAIELHARNCRLVVYLWKPFNKCFAKVRKNISAGNSIIHAYASSFSHSLF